MITAICPTITSTDVHKYRQEMEAVKPFATRVHIDLMDGRFAPSQSPELSSTWWFDNMTADIHLMYKYPAEVADELVKLKPSLVIFHYEAEVDHLNLAQDLRDNGIKAGLAILQDTPVFKVEKLVPNFDHILVFSGHLGYHGGEADLLLTDKVRQLRQLSPSIEIAWDGGINDTNATDLITAGVNVLNVGGYIHNSDNPSEAYAKIKALAE